MTNRSPLDQGDLALPEPSPVSLGKEPLPSMPPGFAIRAVQRLRSFLTRVTDALAPSDLVVFEAVSGLALSQLLGAVARSKIVDELGDQRLTAGEIAARLNLEERAVHRILRALASRGYFSLDRSGRFRNNRLSRALRGGTIEATREWALYFSSASNARAWGDLFRSMESGEASFDRVHGKSVWDWFEDHPDEREIFARTMMGLTVRQAPGIASMYPFAEVKHFCDVGGGRGTLVSELLVRFPHLRATLCDAQGVLDSAKPLLAERGVLDRVTLTEGNFFEQVPSGADAYLLKNVLHDWDDPTCLKILGVVRAAMKPGDKLIVCELLVDELCSDPLATFADLQMMIACSGRERSESELEGLLRASSFSHRNTQRSPIISVLAAVAV